ncbi:MAG: OmpA family protein [Roseovarius sp.]|nr:OmpA family protein [Roseovarius sp.]
MRLSIIFAISGAFAGAAALSVLAAGFAVSTIEDGSRRAVRDALDARGMVWAEVGSDGLQVFLAGAAPDEAARFAALSVAGSVVDATRVIDQTVVEESEPLAPPRFAIEILRNDRGISLIGLVPATLDRQALIEEIARATDGAPVADLLEAADYPAPDTWRPALRHAVRALGDLPRSKISVSAGRVAVTAMVDSAEEKRRVEADLARRGSRDVRLALDISAPRPVITPFTLRFVIDERGARFDACSADTEEARDRILRAAGQAGMAGRADCVIGMGVPSPHWARAAEQAIAALARLGAGSVTMTDADIALLAEPGTDQALFDDVVGALEGALPEVFALDATLPPLPDESAPEAPEFIATLSPEGRVLMRGRLGSAQMRETATSLAQARFAADAVHVTARVAEGLPRDWSTRVLLAIEALAHLRSGAVTVMPDTIDVRGKSGRKEAATAIAQLLADRLGSSERYTIDVEYVEQLDPAAQLPTPEECEARIAAVQDDRKIGFEPGSARVDGTGAVILDEIAAILKDCGEINMEVAGHTDSQGREEMNARLSLERARAVLDELRLRRVLTSGLEAQGYGESHPIADNDTAAGRETNRRIEFRLIRPEPDPEEQTGLESAGDTGDKEDGTEQDGEDRTADEQD